MLRPPNLALFSPPAFLSPYSIALKISKIKASEVQPDEQFCLQMRIFGVAGAESSEAGAVHRLQGARAHRTAAASSSKRRQKGAEQQQQRKAQQQPGCFALLSSSSTLHCTALHEHHLPASRTHLPGKCCKICKFLR